ESRAVRVRHPPVDGADFLDGNYDVPGRVLLQEVTDLLEYLALALIGHDAATDKGRGFRQNLVGGALDGTRFLSDYGDGRLSPGLLVDAGILLGGQADSRQDADVAPQLGLVEGQRLHGLAFLGSERPHAVVEMRDRQLAAIPVKPAQDDIE